MRDRLARRLGGVLLLAALGVFAAALPSFAASGRPDRSLFTDAKAAQGKLNASKTLQAKRAEWDKLVLRYRSLVAKYPQSPYCDDALLAVGDLYREMAVRFKTPRFNDDAVKSYRMLVEEYPSSSLGEKALYSVFEIATASRDRKRIDDAAKLYLATFPDASRAVAVKAALKKSAPEKAAALPPAPPRGLVPVFNLRSWSGDSSTRVVVDLEKEVTLRQDRVHNPERLWVDLVGTRLQPNLTNRVFPVGDGLLEQVRIGQNKDNVVRVVLDFKDVKDHQVFFLQDPTRLVIDVRGNPSTAKPPATADASVTPPAPGPGPGPPGKPPVISEIEDVDSAEGIERAVEERLAAEARAASPTPSPLPTPTPTPSPTPLPTPTPRASPSPRSSPSPSPSPTATPTPAPTPTPPPPTLVASSRPLPSPSPSPTATPLAPQTNRSGSYSLARQLGLSARRIVIDAGHGGHDPGSIGRNGLQEKDLVLDVALRLSRLVKSQLGAEVVMTRDTDAFIPLEERTAIANAKGADLFLSVHANSSRSPKARGIETYFLNFAVDPHAEEVAARENAISAATMKDLQGLVKAITLNSKIDESRDFASSIQESMIEHLRPGYPDMQNRGVRTAPFYVLIGANMPSILAEIAFVSNPEEEKLLKSQDRRQQIAQSLFEGVRKYLEGLNRGNSRQLTRNQPPPTVLKKGTKRKP